MKVLKAVLLSTILGTATLASAQNPSSNSRFETMDIASLTSQASQGNHHAQFFLAKRLQKKVKAYKKTPIALPTGTRVPPNRILLLHS